MSEDRRKREGIEREYVRRKTERVKQEKGEKIKKVFKKRR